MQRLWQVGIALTAGIMVAGIGMAGRSLAWEQAPQPAGQSAGVAASAQGTAAANQEPTAEIPAFRAPHQIEPHSTPRAGRRWPRSLAKMENLDRFC